MLFSHNFCKTLTEQKQHCKVGFKTEIEIKSHRPVPKAEGFCVMKSHS